MCGLAPVHALQLPWPSAHWPALVAPVRWHFYAVNDLLPAFIQRRVAADLLVLHDPFRGLGMEARGEALGDVASVVAV